MLLKFMMVVQVMKALFMMLFSILNYTITRIPGNALKSLTIGNVNLQVLIAKISFYVCHVFLDLLFFFFLTDQ